MGFRTRVQFPSPPPTQKPRIYVKLRRYAVFFISSNTKILIKSQNMSKKTRLYRKSVHESVHGEH